MNSPDQAGLERLSDEVLAAQVARGSSAALEVLYDRYAPTVMGLSLKILGDRPAAEDVLQETFWRVWRSADSYRLQRGPFRAWLFRVARNLAIDSYRRRNVRPRSLADVDSSDSRVDETADLNIDVAEQAGSLFRHRQVRDALAALPRVQRQVIELAYFHGMTRQEIADVMGEALGTIHTRARLALQKLRAELERDEFEE